MVHNGFRIGRLFLYYLKSIFTYVYYELRHYAWHSVTTLMSLFWVFHRSVDYAKGPSVRLFPLSVFHTALPCSPGGFNLIRTTCSLLSNSFPHQIIILISLMVKPIIDKTTRQMCFRLPISLYYFLRYCLPLARWFSGWKHWIPRLVTWVQIFGSYTKSEH